MSYPPYQPGPYGQPPYYGPPGGYAPQPPYDSHPPYGGSPQPPYDTRPPYSAPPPSSRAPPGPPPPLPVGWIQEWEPGFRRAYYLEEATGRTQWETPFESGYEGSRSGPEPSGYYGGAPPAGYYPPPDQPPYEQEKKHSDKGKLLAGGAAGLALGAVGGAILGHELGMFSSYMVYSLLTMSR